MSNPEENNLKSRREFIKSGIRYSLVIGVAGLGGITAFRSTAGETVWQLDPAKCVQCGRCATNCVVSPSAVKCFHVYNMCGYCNLCGGYFRPGAAIERRFIEEPFFEYHIIEELCIGCGKCVKGCGAFGNGSLQLQVNHNLCVNCNECAIARHCPADAFRRVPANDPYLFKGFDKKRPGV